jgi:hypothetical protein
VRARDEPIATEIEAVTAWRGWSLVEEEGELRLSSLTRAESWMPRAPHAASCSKGRSPTPQRRCRCGVYATTTPEALAGLRSLPGGVVGEVSLWGRVIEHGQGYRAEIGYPGRLGLVCAGCLAEGSGRRADVVQRLEAGGRVRLLPWCADHAPPGSHAPARAVGSALLSTYAVDPVSDEMIGRIRAEPRVAAPAEPPRRRRTVVAGAVVAVIGLMSMLALTLPRNDAPVVASTQARILGSVFTGPKTHSGPVPDGGGLLSNYPPIRIMLDASAGVSAQNCGLAEDGTVRAIDCRADGVNAYIFGTASDRTHRSGACTERADLITKRGNRVLCWRLIDRAP